MLRKIERPSGMLVGKAGERVIFGWNNLKTNYFQKAYLILKEIEYLLEHEMNIKAKAEMFKLKTQYISAMYYEDYSEMFEILKYRGYHPDSYNSTLKLIIILLNQSGYLNIKRGTKWNW